MNPLYFDHNATTPLDAEVARTMHDVATTVVGNPASVHRFGRRARQWLEDTREAIARHVGANLDSSRPDQLIFTSGGTEANNLALLGLAGSMPGRLIISTIEHPSVVGPADWLARHGWQVDRLPVDERGVARVDALETLLHKEARLVSLMLGNNETGVLQPVEAIGQLCAARGVLLHVDAVQAVGKIDVDLRALGATAMTLTAHKLHGPVGIGALVIRHGTRLEPQLHGGFQQSGLRPGTESVALAVGFRRALDLWMEQRTEAAARLERLRDDFEQTLQASCPEIEIVGAVTKRLPHTTNIAFIGVEREAMLIALDLAGIACSTGSACASGSSDPSPTLVAMGCRGAVLASALRFSFGRTTTAADVADGAMRIAEIYKDLRAKNSPAKLPPGHRTTTADRL